METSPSTHRRRPAADALPSRWSAPFTLLVFGLSLCGNSIVPQALAATASVSIAATDATAAESGASPTDAATVTINDNDTTVSINATVANAAESGLVPGVFVVSQTDSLGIPIAPAFPVTVNYAISGTAANGTDYSPIATSVVIPANLPTATITITPIDDGLNELNETVILTLAAGSYNIAASPGDAATVTIADNDPAPTVSFNAASSSAPEAVTAS